jgi:hypothetical protein
MTCAYILELTPERVQVGTKQRGIQIIGSNIANGTIEFLDEGGEVIGACKADVMILAPMPTPETSPMNTVGRS